MKFKKSKASLHGQYEHPLRLFDGGWNGITLMLCHMPVPLMTETHEAADYNISLWN